MAGILYPASDVYMEAARQGVQAAYNAWPRAHVSVKSVAKRLSSVRFRRNKKGKLRARPEVKYVDTTIAPNPLTAGGAVSSMTNVAEGTDYNNRVGRCIYGKYMIYDFLVTPPTNSGVSDTGFLAIVQDRQPNGVTPAFADIFVGSGAFSMKNIATNSERFKIIRRWTLPNIDNTAGPQGVHLRTYFSLAKNMKIQFKDNTAAVPITNALFFVGYSNSNSGLATTSFSMTGIIRFAFTDV